MINIGLVSLDVSHPKAFASVMETHCMNMRYKYVYNPGFRTEADREWFVNRFKLDGYKNSIEEMVDEVDVGFIQSCNWDKHLDQAMPFIKSGKPVFIDKPIVGGMADIERLRALVSSAGATPRGLSVSTVAREVTGSRRRGFSREVCVAMRRRCLTVTGMSLLRSCPRASLRTWCSRIWRRASLTSGRRWSGMWMSLRRACLISRRSFGRRLWGRCR